MKPLKLIKDYFILTVASFVFAFAWEGFMIPNGMSAGGMMGLCTVVQYATGGLIEAQYSYIAVNAILIIVAVLVMGIGFGFRTIYCIAMSTLAMQMQSGWDFLHSIPGSFFYVEETLLIPVIAGALEAIGIGIVLRYGGSTGGTDIIALMVNKFYQVSLSTVFLIGDLIIVALLLILPEKNFSDMCYGLVEIVVFTAIIDMVVSGKRTSYQLLIFSDEYQAIADHIIKVMDRGVTILKAQGWYTKKEKEVLLVIIGQKELPALSAQIKSIDPKAFVSISHASSVYGEGFDEIKSGLSLKKKQNGSK